MRYNKKFDVDNVAELINIIESEANEGYQVFVGFNNGDSLYAVTDIDDGEFDALYVESEETYGGGSETSSDDFLELLKEIDSDMPIRCYPARHIDEELEEQMTMETVVKSVTVDDINGDLILLAEVA